MIGPICARCNELLEHGRHHSQQECDSKFLDEIYRVNQQILEELKKINKGPKPDGT